MNYYEVQINRATETWQANAVEEWGTMTRDEKIRHCQLNSQTIGQEWAGLWNAQTAEEAIQMAQADNGPDEWDRL